MSYSASQKPVLPALALSIALAACAVVSNDAPVEIAPREVNPETWPRVETAPLDPEIERQVDTLLAEMTLEQKVGQVIQADSGSVTPELVKQYRLGSVLSGGNSAPGPLPYADAETWLEAADEYYQASLDPEGVTVPIPIIWGIDAVHGHANLKGAVVFPHNIGLGAANDPDLIEEIASVTARQLRVSGHDWTFAPTLAAPQNDRWGRTYEGYSEDPKIIAAYGERIVLGLQGVVGSDDFMGSDRVISSAKHFLGDGGTNNGVDQGDAVMSEAELRDVHAAGYETAIGAGVQTVMASFSAWNGRRMHGHKELLTDVLKERMNFRGFVVGDWNGHGLIPGCTATDCPESLIAGVDMFMAPDSWQELWYNTLEQVKSGEIPMARLDDAVRRILRVKLASNVFGAPLPSERPLAGDVSILGSVDHRDVARRAVRQSLVLLKNEDQVLPLAPQQTVLVIGDGAEDISKASGGWTLSWQGGGIDNSEFPNGESILSGIRSVVESAGGDVIYDPQGTSDAEADVVIAVYGEDPYAEFRGDIPHLDFESNGFDTSRLTAFQQSGIPVVSVFLSGRPMWVNPEINDSKAFIAAWLPGSEGAGVADLLFKTNPDFDFTGRLSFSWPNLATQVKLNPHHEGYDPLFPLGFGLSYADIASLQTLSEDPGLGNEQIDSRGRFFTNGRLHSPWQFMIDNSPIETLPFVSDEMRVSAADWSAQEDAVRVDFAGDASRFVVSSGYGHDYTRESNGAMELVFQAKTFGDTATFEFGMGCDADQDCVWFAPVVLTDEWSDVRLSLSCFADGGVPMDDLERILIVRPQAGASVALSNIRIAEDLDGRPNCGVSE